MTKHVGTSMIGVMRVLLVMVTSSWTLPSSTSAADHASPAQGLSTQAVPGQDPAASARDLLEELASVYDLAISRRLVTLDSNGERQALARVELVALVDSLQSLKADMFDELNRLPVGLPARDSITVQFQGLLQREFVLIEEGLRHRVAIVDSLRAARIDTPVAELGDMETAIESADARVDSTLTAVAELFDDAVAAGLDVEEQQGRFDRYLVSRAAERTGRLQLALTERADLAERLRRAERSAEAGEVQEDLRALAARLLVEDQRIDRLTRSLASTADLLDRRNLPSAPYRQLVIQASGEISTDLLDPRVAVGLVRAWSARAGRWVRETGPDALFRLMVLALSILLTRAALRLGWRLFKFRRRNVSRLFADLLDRLLTPISVVIGFVLGLGLLGVDVTTLLAGIGVAGVIVGFALQESLGNIAAGFFILANRPFDVDDRVTVAGVSGKVRAMGLASTTMVTSDNRRLSIPNNRVWGEVIQNQSSEHTRRVELAVPITYDEDPDRSIRAIEEVCAATELVLDEPPAKAFVDGFGENSVRLVVHAWTENQHWLSVRKELPRLIRMRFKQEGIDQYDPRWGDGNRDSGSAAAEEQASAEF